MDFKPPKQLHEQRQTVTVDRVREVLGRGSRTTLLKHLQQWREHSSEMPEFSFAELPPPVLSLVEALWRAAGEGAKSLVDNERKQLEQTRQELTDAAQNKEGQLQVLTAQLVVYQGSEKRLTEDLLNTKEVLARLEIENAHLSQSLITSQQMVSEKEQQIAIVMRKLNEASIKHQALLLAERERYDAELGRWLLQVDEARQQLRQTNTLNEKLQQALTSLVNPGKPMPKSAKPKTKTSINRKISAKKKE